MDSGSSPSPKDKLQSWLRYHEDLGIKGFYRDRVPTQAPTGSSEPMAPAAGT